MKHHHFRHEWQELIGGMFCRQIVTYCGQQWMSELPAGTPSEPPPHALKASDHCRRCLIAKRKDKGDDYMKAHGYPLIDHPLKGKLP